MDLSPSPRTVLLIAYHYPPCAVGSGLQRTLSFSNHLGQFGWEPVVLTVNPSAYDQSSDNQIADIPTNVVVKRTFALDAARDLAVRGRYWSRLAVPDRWLSWWVTAVPAGLQLIRRHHIQAIWSTYPIATAHMIGATLQRITGLPWIADFRDPMVEHFPELGETFPKDRVLRRARLRVEARAVKRAARVVFCTNTACQIVADRYPAVDKERLRVISNGYEEQIFRDAEALRASPKSGRRILLHSGTIYPGPDRDPTALLQAMRALRDQGRLRPENFELRLRGPSNEAYFEGLAAKTGVSDLVTILPSVSYREAIAEMLSADALLTLQGYTSNPAVPAKLYEYLRTGRPIVGLVHPDGETAATLRALGIDTLTALNDSSAIERLLVEWLSAPRKLEERLPSRNVVAEFSRERLTKHLARLLDRTVHAHDRR